MIYANEVKEFKKKHKQLCGGTHSICIDVLFLLTFQMMLWLLEECDCYGHGCHVDSLRNSC